jgi:hypothetical protein
MNDVDILFLHSVLDERVNGTLRHGIGDFAVPVCHYYSITLTSENVSVRQLVGIVFRQISSHEMYDLRMYDMLFIAQ